MVRKLREQAQIMAKEAAYKDGKGRQGNVSKADPKILKLFIVIHVEMINSYW